jgi:hypothetical protein
VLLCVGGAGGTPLRGAVTGRSGRFNRGASLGSLFTRLAESAGFFFDSGGWLKVPADGQL